MRWLTPIRSIRDRVGDDALLRVVVLPIEETGNSLERSREGRVFGDVSHLLAAEPDLTAVAAQPRRYNRSRFSRSCHAGIRCRPFGFHDRRPCPSTRRVDVAGGQCAQHYMPLLSFPRKSVRRDWIGVEFMPESRSVLRRPPLIPNSAREAPLDTAFALPGGDGARAGMPGSMRARGSDVAPHTARLCMKPRVESGARAMARARKRVQLS